MSDTKYILNTIPTPIFKLIINDNYESIHYLNGTNKIKKLLNNTMIINEITFILEQDNGQLYDISTNITFELEFN